MTEKKNLMQRLLAISEEAGALEKTGQADRKIGGYAFHRIDDVEGALRPLFVKQGVAALPSLVDHATEAHQVRDKTQYVVEAVVDVTFVNADDPTDRATVRSFGQGIDFSDKGPGKAMSYAVKTAYLMALHLKGQPDAEEDDHERAGAPKRQAKSKTKDPYRFPRGDHKGKTVAEAPSDYLEGLLGSLDNKNSELVFAIQAELASRANGAAA